MRAGKNTREANQLQKLVNLPSSWRILNVNNLHSTIPVDDQEGNAFFSNRRLNGSVILKHTTREHEKDLFDSPPAIATKVLIPVDEHDVSVGAITLFVGERSYADIMKQTFGIHVGGRRSSAPQDRDAKLLSMLNSSPSLDIFLVGELLDSAEFGINKKYFEVSLLNDSAIRAYIVKELTPLIRIAAPGASEKSIERFANAIFGSKIGDAGADFFNTLSLPRDQWDKIVFAWKAALFYEHIYSSTFANYRLFSEELQSLSTYGHSDLYPRSLGEEQKKKLADFARRAMRDAHVTAGKFNSAGRASILQSADIQSLREYLEKLPEAIQGFGCAIGIIDHILSYWNYCCKGLDKSKMPAEVFCQMSAQILGVQEQFGNA